MLRIAHKLALEAGIDPMRLIGHSATPEQIEAAALPEPEAGA